jgi:hypothetical protein
MASDVLAADSTVMQLRPAERASRSAGQLSAHYRAAGTLADGRRIGKCTKLGGLAALGLKSALGQCARLLVPTIPQLLFRGYQSELRDQAVFFEARATRVDRRVEDSLFGLAGSTVGLGMFSGDEKRQVIELLSTARIAQNLGIAPARYTRGTRIFRLSGTPVVVHEVVSGPKTAKKRTRADNLATTAAVRMYQVRVLSLTITGQQSCWCPWRRKRSPPRGRRWG